MIKTLPNRQSIRLKNYDYSIPGYYFITICTHNRIHRFGDIVGCQMQMNHFGEIVLQQWNKLPQQYTHIQLDQFILMPNHIHGLFQIIDHGIRAGEILGAFKSLCVHHCLKWIQSNNPSFHMGRLWQRNFWKHIVRDEIELHQLREYIINNPMKWDNDEFNGGVENIVIEESQVVRKYD